MGDEAAVGPGREALARGAQGYLFAAPMAAADFEELLSAGPVAMLDPAATGA